MAYTGVLRSYHLSTGTGTTYVRVIRELYSISLSVRARPTHMGFACVSCALEKDQGSSPPSHKVGYGSRHMASTLFLALCLILCVARHHFISKLVYYCIGEVCCDSTHCV